MSYNFLGPQIQPAEVDTARSEEFRESYRIRAAVVSGDALNLMKSRNQAYTYRGGRFVALSPGASAGFDLEGVVDPTKRYVYAAVIPKEGKPLWSLVNLRVRVTSGAMEGAILTIKPGNLFFGPEVEFGIVSALNDPVQSFYEIPEDTEGVTLGQLDVEIVSVAGK